MRKSGTGGKMEGCLRRLRGVNIGRLLIGMVLLGLLWRTVRYALDFPLWGDEAMAICSLTTRGFAGLIRPLEFGVSHPVGYMWAQWLVAKTLGISELAVRLIPYALGIISVFVFWGFARQFLDRRSLLLAVTIFACSYYLTRYSAETKPYCSDMFIALVMTWVGWSVFQEPENVGRWLVVTVISAAALWASYPAMFVAGGTGLVLTWHILRRPSFKLVACWLAYGVCVALSFAAFYMFVVRYQYQSVEDKRLVEGWGPYFPPLGTPSRLPLWLLNVHISSIVAYPVGGKYGESLVSFLLVVVGAILLWRRKRALVILLLSPLIFNFAAAAVKRYPYGCTRTSLYMAPAFCLLIGAGFNGALRALLPKRCVSAGIVLATLIIGLVVVFGIGRDIAQPYKNEWDRRTRHLTAWLAGRTHPEDEWIVFNAFKKVDYAPDIRDYMGSGGRFMYYVTKDAPCSLLWSPPPGDIPWAQGGKTWLIVYHDNEIPVPEGQLASYRQKLIERLGEPRRYYFPLGRTIEAIEVYEFPEKTQGQPGGIPKRAHPR